MSIDLTAQGDLTIGGDVVGRDKIVNNIQNIVQRALTAAEEASGERALETQLLAQGVSAFAQRLQAIASDTGQHKAASPYKGLLAYGLSDAEIFFGRSQAIASLLKRLGRGAFTVLQSESGAGKSSLLQAGISPRLITAGHLPLYLRPYNANPAYVIKRAFIADLGRAPWLATAPLREYLRLVAGVLGPQTTLYLILDQAEELFTQLDTDSRAEFVAELADCLNDPSLRVRWLLSLRTEFFGNLADFRPQIQNPFENDYRLNRLNRAEAGEVIAEPARRQGVSFEAGLVETLLDDLGKDDLPPPQIQLVCSGLYDGLPAGATTITRAQYIAAGGAAGILRDHLAHVMARDLKPEQRPIAQGVFEALITADGRRAVRSKAELLAELSATLPENLTPESLAAVLSQLVDSRLLLAYEQEVNPAQPGPAYQLAPGLSPDMTAGLVYELAHDYLLDQIKLDPAVQARKAAQELLEQEVRAYERHGTLLSDDKLAIIAPRRGEMILSDQARKLIQRSEQALRRRQRFVLGGVGLVILLVVVGALSLISAFGANRQRQSAIGTQRAAETAAAGAAALQVASELRAAGASTQEANARAAQATSEAGARIASTQAAIARATIRKAFENTRLVTVGDRPNALAFDGARLWVANYLNGTVQAIDPATGDAGQPIPVGVGPSALVFDGTRLWVANEFSGTVQAIDPATGDVGAPTSVGSRPTDLTLGSRPTALAFDGARLWVANQTDNTVQAIDPATGETDVPISVGPFPTALAFDGTLLWVANLADNTVQAIDPATGKTGPPIRVGAGPSALAFDGTRLWVASLDGTVQALDPTTGEIRTSITVGVGPSALLFDGVWLWVANGEKNTVQAIDPVTSATLPLVAVGSGPSALAFDGTWLWVANKKDNTLLAIDPATVGVGMPIRVGDYPFALAFDGTRLWVANYRGDTVQAIDTATGDVDAPIPVGSGPSALVFDGTRLWVAAGRSVQALNPATGETESPIQVNVGSLLSLIFDGTRLWAAALAVQAIDPATGEVGTPIRVNGDPTALAFDGTRLWVATFDGTVQALDPATGELSAPIPVGSHPSALAFDGTRLWVANYGDHTVQAIDPATGETESPIRVRDAPSAIIFDGVWLWVAKYATVQAIDPATGETRTSITVGAGPSNPLRGGLSALAFDGTRLWVANPRDNTVQSIQFRRQHHAVNSSP